MEQSELDKVVLDHGKWLRNEEGVVHFGQSVEWQHLIGGKCVSSIWRSATRKPPADRWQVQRRCQHEQE